jgi:hypothetical protein
MPIIFHVTCWAMPSVDACEQLQGRHALSLYQIQAITFFEPADGARIECGDSRYLYGDSFSFCLSRTR